jgi:hypothetical protein
MAQETDQEYAVEELENTAERNRETVRAMLSERYPGYARILEAMVRSS